MLWHTGSAWLHQLRHELRHAAHCNELPTGPRPILRAIRQGCGKDGAERDRPLSFPPGAEAALSFPRRQGPPAWRAAGQASTISHTAYDMVPATDGPSARSDAREHPQTCQDLQHHPHWRDTVGDFSAQGSAARLIPINALASAPVYTNPETPEPTSRGSQHTGPRRDRHGGDGQRDSGGNPRTRPGRGQAIAQGRPDMTELKAQRCGP